MAGTTRSLRTQAPLKVSTIDAIGAVLGRYGLVIVIGWIGGLKFANFEAHQIAPLVAHSPFMSWLYTFFSEYTFSALLGVVEVGCAVLLAVKPFAPKLSIIGSVLAILLFISTISFLFSTPGVTEPAGGGFPALSLTGEFLLKDIPLLGLSVWSLGDALKSVQERAVPAGEVRNA
jgi:reactive chlorine resistance protein C